MHAFVPFSPVCRGNRKMSSCILLRRTNNYRGSRCNRGPATSSLPVSAPKNKTEAVKITSRTTTMQNPGIKEQSGGLNSYLLLSVYLSNTTSPYYGVFFLDGKLQEPNNVDGKKEHILVEPLICDYILTLISSSSVLNDSQNDLCVIHTGHQEIFQSNVGPLWIFFLVCFWTMDFQTRGLFQSCIL